MTADTGSNLRLQAAVKQAMNVLLGLGSPPDESAVLIMSLMLHRQRQPATSNGGSSESQWDNFRDADPIYAVNAVNAIVDDIESLLRTSIERPELTPSAALQVMELIDESYRADGGFGSEPLSVEGIKALSGTLEGVSTPESIAVLMAEILDPKPGHSIHDPAIGSGALLLASLSFAKQKSPDALPLVSGSDNTHQVRLASMNLSLHGFPTGGLMPGDAFDKSSLAQALGGYDYIISNPPVSRQLSADVLADLKWHPAFLFGPPLKDPDLNFIQLAASLLKPGGRALLLVRLKPLFASGKPQKIRQRLLEEGYVEAVVTLPDRLLSTTSAACAVLILRAPLGKSPEVRVKLIDAGSESGDDPTGKRILTRANIDKIVAAVNGEELTDGFATLKSVSELSAKGYGLLPAFYFQPDPPRINLGPRTTMKRLGTIAQVLSCPSLGSLPKGDTPILQGRDLSQRMLLEETLERRDISLATTDLERTVTGDILVQRISKSPASRYVDQRLAGIAVSDTVYIVRLRDPDEMTARFIVEFLNSTAGRGRLRSPMSGAMIPTLPKFALKEVEVPLTDPVVMKFALEVDHLETTLHHHLEAVAELKSKLFNITDEDHFVSSFKALQRRHESLKMLKLDAESLAAANAAVGLAALEGAVSLWKQHQDSGDERFWHSVLDERPFLLAQLFHFPIVIIESHAYVGGKKLDDQHGSIADFLAKTRTTGAALIIEIKTPGTPLLALPYRQDVYPWSKDISGALSQVLHYRSSLTQNIRELREGKHDDLESDLPRCIVIAGNVSKQLNSSPKRRSFERLRESLHGVSVIGFDELFGRAAGILEVLKNPG